MEKYAKLINHLYYTYSHIEKIHLIREYLETTPDPDRGYAIALIDGALQFKFLTRPFIKAKIYESIDPFLFDLSYNYVGDLAETIAHEIVNNLLEKDKVSVQNYFIELLNNADLIERWALLKLAFHNLRIGVSSRFLKQSLAAYGKKPLQEIEGVWHTLTPPYDTLFAWLEDHAPKPTSQEAVFFQPVMLCQPLSEKELPHILPEEFAAEWKYDGIRIQYISTGTKSALYSRTGDDISLAFPDVAGVIPSRVVLDGELMIKTEHGFGTFNDLQQRLNRKLPSKTLIEKQPAHLLLYDILSLENENLRDRSFEERRQLLETWIKDAAPDNMSLSPLLTFDTHDQLRDMRKLTDSPDHPQIEGLIFKRKSSPYIAGRPAGYWYKWKRDPFLIDAVLMYAQRGHGKRSSFYSDYTFGLWKADSLLPVGKAYSGFSDEELKMLDRWVRHNTVQKFGPVVEVKKALVFEIAFENISFSARHKSGYALRFPRIHRIRWDKPAEEADQLDVLAQWVKSSVP
jgi:DNA ligase-1